VTRCLSATSDCRATRHRASDGSSLGEVPQLSGEKVRYSPEGHWLVSNNQAFHIPSGAVLDYAPAATVAVFSPEGDIIAGEADGSLVRYCRSSP
jgi:hypothetical protein